MLFLVFFVWFLNKWMGNSCAGGLMIKDLAVVKILTYWLRICSTKRGREGLLSHPTSISELRKSTFCISSMQIMLSDSWGGEANLRAHTADSPRLCANTDETGEIYDIRMTESIIFAPSVAVCSGKRKCECAEQDDFDFKNSFYQGHASSSNF